MNELQARFKLARSVRREARLHSPRGVSLSKAQHQARRLAGPQADPSLYAAFASRLLRNRGAAGGVLVGAPSGYSRCGSKPEPGLVPPYVPPEYFQALLLASSLPRGVVTFHDAFSARSQAFAAGATAMTGPQMSSIVSQELCNQPKEQT